MTTEYIAQMLPMLLLAGALVAWVVQLVPKTGGYGFLPDMALCVVGGVLAGAVVRAGLSGNAGMLGMFAIGGLGAILALVAQRGLWRPARVRS